LTVQQSFIVFSTRGTWITSTHKLSWMTSPLLYYKTKQRWTLYLVNKPSNFVMKSLCSFLRFFASLYFLSSPPLFHLSILYDSLRFISVLLIKASNVENHQTSRPVTVLIKGGKIVTLRKKNNTKHLCVLFHGKMTSRGITSANLVDKNGNIVGMSNKLHISNNDAYT